MMEYIDRNLCEIVAEYDQYYKLVVPLEKIRKMPAADVVPVVRCRECKHFNLETHECENEALSTDHEGGASYSLNFYDDDFCSFGERSTNKSTNLRLT